MSFPRYPKYRDSGVEWIGEVPEHWEVIPIRRIGNLFKGNGGSKEDDVEEGIPCVRYGDLYSLQTKFIRSARACVAPGRVRSYTTIRRGDLLFAASGETLEDIGRSAVNLIDEEACCGGDVLVLRPTISSDSRFLGYVADSDSARHQKATMGRGFTVVHIYGAQLKRLMLPLPPVREQSIIATFLDDETAKIGALVEEQRKLIDLLKEKRLAVISHAVTKGLNPDVPMKPSGIEWIGEVPAHWEKSRLRCLFRPVKRQDQPDYPVLSVYREFGVILKDSRDDNLNKTPDDLRSYQLVRQNDLVVNKMKAWQGSLGISCLVGITSPDYVVLTPRHQEHSEFLHLLLRSQQMVTVYRGISNGIRLAQWRLETDRFLDLPVFLPPVPEQRVVADFVAEQISRIENLVVEAQTLIELLNERRAALISAAVTGQIDVRSTVASSTA